MDMMLKRGAGIAVFIASMLLFVFYGFWDHDGGYYLLQASIVNHGYKPWVDYTSLYPPLMYLLDAIPLKLGFTPWQITWGLPLVWVIVISLLTARCLKRICEISAGTALALGSFYALFCIEFGGNHLTLEHGVVFFGMLIFLATLYVIFKKLKSGRLRQAGMMLSWILVGVVFYSEKLVKPFPHYTLNL